MDVYLFLIFILILLCFIRAKWAYAVAFLLLLLVGGLRDLSVGTDTTNYLNLYEWYGGNVLELLVKKGPLFLMIQFISAINGWGFQVLLLLFMAITLVLLFYAINKCSVNPNYSVLCYVLLYFYFHSFNIVRQYLAIPFILLSYYYLLNGNLKKYFVFLLIGVGFHSSAIISLIALPLYKLKIKNSIWIMFLVITFLIGITPFAQNFMQYIGPYIGKYSIYTEESNSFIRDNLFSVSRLLLNLYAIVLLVMLKEKSFMLSILTFGICLLNLFAFQPVAGRICQYFTIVQIILIPEIPILIRTNYNTNFLSIGSFVYMLLTWLYLINANSAGVVPWEYGGLL